MSGKQGCIETSNAESCRFHKISCIIQFGIIDFKLFWTDLLKILYVSEIFKIWAITPGLYIGIRGVCYLSIFLEKISSSPNSFRIVVKMFGKEGGVILYYIWKLYYQNIIKYNYGHNQTAEVIKNRTLFEVLFQIILKIMQPVLNF